MAYYLIDYENVNVDGFNGLTSLTEKDTVIVFYSENASTLTFGLHRRLNETKAVLEFQNINIGTKNALDFQLATYLGYMIRDTENAAEKTFYIVSNDCGFKVLSLYWEKRHINVKMISSLTGEVIQPVLPAPPKKDEPPQFEQIEKSKENDKIKNAVKGVLSKDDEIETAVKIIKNGRTKSQINSELTKKFKDGKKVSKIHKAVKSFIKNLPS